MCFRDPQSNVVPNAKDRTSTASLVEHGCVGRLVNSIPFESLGEPEQVEVEIRCRFTRQLMVVSGCGCPFKGQTLEPIDF